MGVPPNCSLGGFLASIVVYFLFPVQAMVQQEVSVAQLVDMFCTEGLNKMASLHYLGPLLSNLSQLPDHRGVMLDPHRSGAITM